MPSPSAGRRPVVRDAGDRRRRRAAVRRRARDVSARLVAAARQCTELIRVEETAAASGDDRTAGPDPSGPALKMADGSVTKR